MKVLLAAIALLTFCAAVLAWLATNLLHRAAFRPQIAARRYPIEVVEADTEQVILRARERMPQRTIATPGTWSMEWPGGLAAVGPVQSNDGEGVTRTLLPGSDVPVPGTRVRLATFVAGDDPLEAHGIAFEEVAYASELGPMPAWHVPGERDCWVIIVHGKGATRAESLRILPSIVEAGYPVFVPAYRNDPDCPSCPTGRYGYGATEWHDIEAALKWAFVHGPRRAVLIGYSMGGAIVAALLRQSPLASAIDGVILDAPMLSFERTIDERARDFGLPRGIVRLGKRLAMHRFGFDWQSLDYIDDIAGAGIPVLLFHGDVDELVPVATSRDLAGRAPQHVHYVETPGARHVASWNVAPGDYETAVREFLERVCRTAGSGAVEPAAGGRFAP